MRRLAGLLLHALAALALALPAQAANKLTGPPFSVDHFRADTAPRHFDGETSRMGWSRGAGGLALRDVAHAGWYVSPPARAPFRFTELLPSWNIALDEETQGYRIEVRVQDARDGTWSPWFYFGTAGRTDGSTTTAVIDDDAWGEVDIDYLLLKRPARAHQYKVILYSDPDHGDTPQPAVKRFHVVVSNIEGDRALHRRVRRSMPRAAGDWATTLTVPYRAQRWVDDRRLGGEICCPTCVAMVLESHGIEIGTVKASANALDHEHDIYGNWPRAAQSVVRHGLASEVRRFRETDDLKPFIAAGLPVMASIRAARGEMQNARYKSTNGHLILVIGLTPGGDFVVNDPASPGAGGEEIVYTAEEIRKVWFEKGGVGIVIWNPDKTASGKRTH